MRRTAPPFICEIPTPNAQLPTPTHSALGIGWNLKIGIWDLGVPMSTPVVMPQMGESIAEGTIVRWIKKVGDPVDRDEPLFEISTDKVDAEIPSPAAGVLTEIKVTEGETVAVNSIVATIGDGRDAAPAGEMPATAPRQGAELAAASTQRQPDGEDPVASRKPAIAAASTGNGATARPAAASTANAEKPNG